MYCIDHHSDEPIMLINTHIGSDETDGQGIDGSLFQQELLQLDSLGKKRIEIAVFLNFVNYAGNSRRFLVFN